MSIKIGPKLKLKYLECFSDENELADDEIPGLEKEKQQLEKELSEMQKNPDQAPVRSYFLCRLIIIKFLIG